MRKSVVAALGPALGIALLSVLLPASGSAETVALAGGTIHPITSAPVEDGVLLVEDGTIVAVGPRAEIEIPEGARVVDLTGKHLYPTFIHPSTVLGLTEVSSVEATVDTDESGAFNPELRVESSFNADSMLLPPAMGGGVLFAHVVPDGGILTGTSALMRLDGWNWQDMTVKAPVGLHLKIPALPDRDEEDPAKKRQEERERKRQMKELEALFGEAEAYGRALEAAAKGLAAAPLEDRRLAALLPVLAGEMPLFLHAEEKALILEGLDLVQELGIEGVVLVAGPDAAEVTERLLEEKVAVILTGVLQLPTRSWRPYDEPFTAAARLHGAGVPFALGDSGSGFEASNARNLPFHAAMAAAHGLPREVALAAITLRPAQLLGVDDRLGSLETGKEASFVVTDGDPLEITTRIEGVWSLGEPLDLSRDRQRRLYERYRHRPDPAP